MTEPCPCGAPIGYAGCCGRYLDATQPAPSAEALMRSRYTAFVRGREDYLLATWHPDFRPDALNLSADPPTKWLGLTVKRHIQTDDDHASVEFIARYKIGGRAHRLHETSRFVRVGGRWHYTDGDLHPS